MAKRSESESVGPKAKRNDLPRSLSGQPETRQSSKEQAARGRNDVSGRSNRSQVTRREAADADAEGASAQTSGASSCQGQL